MKFKLKILNHTLLVLTIFVSSIEAHGAIVKGRVMGRNGELIPGASCVATNPADSAFIAATISDGKGLFSLECENETIILTVSSLGYKNKELTISGSADIKVKLEQENEQLAEVVVKGSRPQLTADSDGSLHYDVTGILKEKIAPDALSLLKNLPLITSTDGTSIQLTGAPTGHTIFINGQKPQMSARQLTTYLQNLPSDQIKDVEIIYDAPPKWRVTGAVINVILKKSANLTYNGQLRANYTNASANQELASGSFFFSSPKWSFNTMYYFQHRHQLFKTTTEARHKVGEEIYNILDTARNDWRDNNHSIYASAAYTIDANNSLELTYNGTFSPKQDSKNLGFNTIIGLSESRSSGREDDNAATLTFTSKKGINAGLEYLNRYSDSHETYLPATSAPIRYLILQKINRGLAYANLDTGLGKGWRLTYGGSFELIDSRSSQTFEETDEGSSKSNLKEKDTKIYAGFQKSLLGNMLSLRASLTADFYSISDYHKNSLLPLVSVSYMPSQSHILRASYRSYRKYPSFWSKGNFETWTDSYHINLGNPDLKPSTVNSWALTYILKSRYVASLSYTRTGNFILTQPYQLPDRLTEVTQPQNIDFMGMMQFAISAPLKPTDWYSVNLTGMLLYGQYKASDWHDMSFNRKKVTGQFFAANTFTISSRPKIQATLIGVAATPSISGITDVSPIWTINAGVNASLLKDNLILGLNASNIFESMPANQKVRFRGQWFSQKSNYYNRLITVDLTWRFGGYVEKQQRTIDKSRFGF